jgi:arginine-tRNA-protein transferase
MLTQRSERYARAVTQWQDHFVEDPRPCDYLPTERASLEYRVMAHLDAVALEALLVRGWRRLGPFYFRPACAGCFECVPLRIPVAAFRPTRSQARALARSRRFQTRIGVPRVDEARLDLYSRWHAGREERRGWGSSPLGADEYRLQFAFPHTAVREITWWDEGRLVAVGLHDVTPRAWSAIYFFSDPAIARTSPGVANVMTCVLLARERGIPHVYLGYRVLGCPSMRYKAAFRPHELLVGRPGDLEEPLWTPAPPPPPGAVKSFERL